jgi:hypothetical protein
MLHAPYVLYALGYKNPPSSSNFKGKNIDYKNYENNGNGGNHNNKNDNDWKSLLKKVFTMNNLIKILISTVLLIVLSYSLRKYQTLRNEEFTNIEVFYIFSISVPGVTLISDYLTKIISKLNISNVLYAGGPNDVNNPPSIPPSNPIPPSSSGPPSGGPSNNPSSSGPSNDPSSSKRKLRKLAPAPPPDNFDYSHGRKKLSISNLISPNPPSSSSSSSSQLSQSNTQNVKGLKGLNLVCNEPIGPAQQENPDLQISQPQVELKYRAYYPDRFCVLSELERAYPNMKGMSRVPSTYKEKMFFFDVVPITPAKGFQLNLINGRYNVVDTQNVSNTSLFEGGQIRNRPEIRLYCAHLSNAIQHEYVCHNIKTQNVIAGRVPKSRLWCESKVFFSAADNRIIDELICYKYNVKDAHEQSKILTSSQVHHTIAEYKKPGRNRRGVEAMV